jgi:Helix-turn-helix domain
MVKKREAEISVLPSSGNAFADLGFAEPEEELTQAQLASHHQAPSPDPGGRRCAHGHRPAQVSALLNERLANFSSERLMRLLTMLGQNVKITVKAKPRNRAHGRIRVIDTAHV